MHQQESKALETAGTNKQEENRHTDQAPFLISQIAHP